VLLYYKLRVDAKRKVLWSFKYRMALFVYFLERNEEFENFGMGLKSAMHAPNSRFHFYWVSIAKLLSLLSYNEGGGNLSIEVNGGKTMELAAPVEYLLKDWNFNPYLKSLLILNVAPSFVSVVKGEKRNFHGKPSSSSSSSSSSFEHKKSTPKQIKKNLGILLFKEDRSKFLLTQNNNNEISFPQKEYSEKYYNKRNEVIFVSNLLIDFKELNKLEEQKKKFKIFVDEHFLFEDTVKNVVLFLGYLKEEEIEGELIHVSSPHEKEKKIKEIKKENINKELIEEIKDDENNSKKDDDEENKVKEEEEKK